jgi:hypothetical protein
MLSPCAMRRVMQRREYGLDALAEYTTGGRVPDHELVEARGVWVCVGVDDRWITKTFDGIRLAGLNF